ncbi:type I-G CRISPR-associated protein, Cas3-extension family [Roseospira navarrensis]|uniref:Uncharacterized protein n=1 Tax=Roseospira navarrensis TaxID=140058 RepID=A0A7X1ZIV7_9PROT|nr:hypothetical protein [Roseospira navarrensis]MQX38252.1 hypothetical protein [Roseospira navarrensis]
MTDRRDPDLFDPPPAPDQPGETAHRLIGLEPDNLLAFLALLGLLRALEAARPDWRPRAQWDPDHPPLRPVLTLATPATQADIAQAAAEGCGVLAADHRFEGHTDVTFDQQTARALLDEATNTQTRGRAALLGAVFSDGAVKDDGKVAAAPLVAMFGQGHQHFLTRLSDVPKGVLPKSLAKKKKKPLDLNHPDRLAAALFAPWTRQDETDGFRWDPEEDRRYALRYRDPSKDAGRTEHGANRLAAVGLAALPGAAVERRGQIHFLTLGTELAPGRGGRAVTWPIWARPASLATIQALLGHPALAAATPPAETLRRLGVIGIHRARRIAVGKYFNFTRAEAL